MSGLTGAIKPTWRYPRFVWNGVTLDFDDPLAALQSEDMPVIGQNVAPSGLREALWERTERQVVLALGPLSAVAARALERMLLEWAERGEQVEVYLDSVLRAWWGFDEGEPLLDNNGGNAWLGRDWNGAFTLAAAGLFPEGSGFLVPSTGVVRAPLVSSLPGGSGNTFLSASEGTIVLQIRPAFSFNDGAEHLLLDCLVQSTPWKNRLTLTKRPPFGGQVDALVLGFTDGSGYTTYVVADYPAVAWAAATVHIVSIQWKAQADLQLCVDGQTYTTKAYPPRSGTGKKAGDGTVAGQRFATGSGGETVLTAPPDVGALGGDAEGVRGRMTGYVGRLALYQRAWGLPNAAETWQHPWRSYYPRAEFVDGTVRLVRATQGRELFAYTLRIREGS